ncbi:GntR family transcriptional regulator [Roseitranquillus sediminis]|uniref:GntR family transcriptional regulator n=1 Tax=Roseitranquillus sediminis TaxID=2809051 RepID=UPI001D0BF915|nr:GntR family transcriptional regulator [Roseitranquillus sediminis]MBM9593164.1 GntR family transcriptional regulator [Roseitranquillus sediminis]
MKLRRETVSEQCVQLLRDDILERRRPPGTVVTEEAMAQELGVSRPTVREVLNTLTVEGLLTRNRTTRALHVTRLGADTIREIYRARRLLEAGGVTAFAGREDGALGALAAETEKLVSAIASGDVRTITRQDIRCHVELVALVGSTDLTEFYAGLLAKLRLAMADVSVSESYDLVAMGEDHVKFVELMQSRRIEDARRFVLDRLNRAEMLLLASTRIDSDTCRRSANQSRP